jgi:pyruvate dehydrogenase E1 component
LLNFRQEVGGKGLSSYPHPKLMPEFWQFPTVSMGLGPLMAIYQARFLKYLHARGIADTAKRKVWVFCGDGEMDEPESLGAISLAAREKLDNLVFVVNCNLQRLDGPVRGNGKIIQELEGEFRGAGWNVIKLIWGSNWDSAAGARQGRRACSMMDTLDGDYQAFKANDGAFVRKHFFGRDPRTLEMVSKMSDDDIWNLRRGGHDPPRCTPPSMPRPTHQGQPTVLLVKTVKGYGMGGAGEGKNTAHQTKKLTTTTSATSATVQHPDPRHDLAKIPFYKPADDTPEMKYLHERRQGAGRLPAAAPPPGRRRVHRAAAGDLQGGARAHRRGPRDQHHAGLRAIPDAAAARQGARPARRADPARRGAHLRHGRPVPPDRHLQPRGPEVHAGRQGPGDVLPRGQGRPDPAGRHQRGRRHGQLDRRGDVVLTNNRDDPVLHLLLDVRLPADRRPGLGRRRHAGARVPARRHAGRTTLNGEGLQHEDGHSHILAGTIPNCISYDPTFAHEVGVILHHGLKRMVEKQDNVFFYLTLLNENYPMPGLKAGTEEQILKGMYLLQEGAPKTPRVNLLGSGTILRESMAAGPAREGLGRGRQRVELPELQRAGARRPGLRALEPAAPHRRAARALRGAAARPAMPAR